MKPDSTISKWIQTEILDCLFDFVLPVYLISETGKILHSNKIAREFIYTSQTAGIYELLHSGQLNIGELEEISDFLNQSVQPEIADKMNKQHLILPVKFYGDTGKKLFLLVLGNHRNINRHKFSKAAKEKEKSHHFLEEDESHVNSGKLQKKNDDTHLSQTSDRIFNDRLTPRILPEIKKLSFSYHYEAGSFFGGDLFNVIKKSDGQLAFYIADVSSDGLFSVTMATLFKKLLEKQILKRTQPSEVLEVVNRKIHNFFFLEDFVSVFLGFLNLETYKLVFTNAGHPSPLLFYSKMKSPEKLDTRGYLLGIFENGNYETRQSDCPPGSKIFLYTDGIFEINNREDQYFGKIRLERVFNSMTTKNNSGKDILNKLLPKSLNNYEFHSNIIDDRMMVLIEVNY
jgi:serine phosphatase RsbU (regulator of sigma subunit)